MPLIHLECGRRASSPHWWRPFPDVWSLSQSKGRPRSRGALRACGFTIIELIVAILVGLIVILALAVVFVRASQGRYEIERSSRQIENGRYAMQLLIDDLRLAGYFAEFDPRVLATPATKPDACATAVATLQSALALHVQGYDNPSGSAVAALTCLSNVRAGSDILVIRRASSCVPGSSGCDTHTSGAPYFQASLCYNSTELNGPVTNWYRLDTDSAAFNLHKRNCNAVADLHRYLTRIYFVANDDKTATHDGIPTLKMVELDDAGAFSAAPIPLVQGIENMQIVYGIDTNADGAPDVFTADPDSYNGCSGVACMNNWRNVVAAKLYLLVRNTETSPGYSDQKKYWLEQTQIEPGITYYASGAAPCNAAATCYPVGYRRHVYQAEVRLNNPSGRNSTP